VESELAVYQDEKHQFWLYLLYLQEGKLMTAQNLLDNMSESSLKELGKGLMLFSKGDAVQAQRIITETEMNWKTLSIEQQTIRHLTLAQAAMTLEDYPAAQTELKAAEQLNPNNPACLSVAFDLAIEEEQWTKAVELSQSIDTQTWRPRNSLYETKKAILAIYEGNLQGLSNSRTSLKDLSQGEVCLKYVNGIQALAQGQLDEGKNFLVEALNNGLEGELKVDAQKALNQILDRQKADLNLRTVIAPAEQRG